MMSRTIALLLAASPVGGLCACAPKPAGHAPSPPVAGLAPSPPPARNMVMVCRDSRTGAKADCGSPGAVMVGMKPE